MKQLLCFWARLAGLCMAFIVMLNGVLCAQVGPGHSMLFDSAGARMTITNVTLSPPWSVELWVKRIDGKGPSAPLFASSAASLRLEQYQANRRVGFTQTGVDDFEFNYVAPSNEWVHLTFVGAAQETCLLVNGKFHSCLNIRSFLPLEYFGSIPSASTEQLRAEVDEVRVWRVERTEAEVQASMRRRLRGTEQGLVGYWNFDGSSSTVVSNQVIRAVGATNFIAPNASVTQLSRRTSNVLFAPDFAEPRFEPGQVHETILRAGVHPGNLPTTVQLLLGTTLTESGTTIDHLPTSTLSYSVASNTVRNIELPFAFPADGRIIHARLVASNEVGVSYSGAYAWSPIMERTEAESIFLECGTVRENRGVSAYFRPIAFATGLEHSLALSTDGRVRGWGSPNFFADAPPSSATNVIAIAAGERHSMALRADGRVLVWGLNTFGQATVPAGLVDIVAIAAGHNHNLALRRDGRVFAWGANDAGQSVVPVGMTNISAVAAGWRHNLVLRENGSVSGWGDNTHGQLNVPASITNVVTLAAGDAHSAALTADGRLITWGRADYARPELAAGITNAVAVSLGSRHVLVLLADGRLVTWGDNEYGQLNVSPATTNVVVCATGFFHGLAMARDGSIAAWGENQHRQGYPIPQKIRPSVPVVAEPTTFTATMATDLVRYSITNDAGVFEMRQDVEVADTTAPRMTLLGLSYLVQPHLAAFVDPGCVAVDACDGPLVVTTNGVVDVARPGHYIISYQSTDTAGHSSTISRVVVVDSPLVAEGLNVWSGGKAVDGAGYWFDPGNWSLGVIPRNDAGRHSSVRIVGPPGATRPKVTLDTFVTIDELTVEAAELAITGELYIDGGSITNSGLIRIGTTNDPGFLSFLTSDGTARFTTTGPGTSGQIELARGGFIDVVSSAPNPPSVLHNGPGHQIAGGGRIYVASLINEGSISADGAHSAHPQETMDIFLRRLVNRGVIESRENGLAMLNWGSGASLDNTNGLILARRTRISNSGIKSRDNGGSAPIVCGGTLAAVEEGYLRIGSDAGNSIGLTFNGVRFTNDVSSSIQVVGRVELKDCDLLAPLLWGQTNAGNSVLISGTIRNQATQSMGTLNRFTSVELLLLSDVTFEGTGTWRFPNSSYHKIFGTAVVLTNGPGHTIAGAGSIFGSGFTVVNEGTIEADVPGDWFRIESGRPMPDVFAFRDGINRGELGARNGGRLELEAQIGSAMEHYGIIRAAGSNGTHRSTVTVSGVVNGTGSWIADDGGRIVFRPDAEVYTQGEIEIGPLSALEWNSQNLIAPIAVQRGGQIDVSGVCMMSEPLSMFGMIRFHSGGVLVVPEIAGDGYVYDPESHPSLDYGETWVERAIRPQGFQKYTAGVLRFDSLSAGDDFATLEMDLYGPAAEQQDRIEVRRAFAAAGAQLDLRFHFEPSPSDVFTLVQSVTRGITVISNLSDVSFGQVRRVTPDYGQYQDDEFMGDVFFLPDRIYLTNVRRLSSLALSAPRWDPSESNLLFVDALAAPGQHYIWQQSATMLPGSWRNIGEETWLGRSDAVLIFNRTGGAYEFFRAVDRSLPCLSYPPGLVHAWLGADASDSVGTNHVDFLGGIGLADGRVGSGFKFDGVDDRLHLGAAAIPAGAVVGGWTVSMWVRREDSLDASSALLMNSTHALKLEQYGTPDRRVGFTVFGVDDFSFPFTASHEWTHLVFKDTAVGTRLFANGVSVAFKPNRIPLPLEYLGGPVGDRLRGGIDEVLVFNRELNEIEIQALAQRPRIPGVCRDAQ